MRVLLSSLFLLASLIASSQTQTAVPPVWQMQDSGTAASLRGIHSVDGKVAWASGTGGTILKTTDGGEHWLPCAIPDAATDGATLDFRGVQAWEADTAIVMASGPGEKSRLYKTTDGCRTWKLLLKNPDKDGFWDAFKFRGAPAIEGWILGDPVNGQFAIWKTFSDGVNWNREGANAALMADPRSQGAFAASNSSMLLPEHGPQFLLFGSGGKLGAFVYAWTQTVQNLRPGCNASVRLADCIENSQEPKNIWKRFHTPVIAHAESAGIFSIAARYFSGHFSGIVVGGNYEKPETGMAARSINGEHWTASTIPPHGYRSSVQWGEALKAWITVGANGSDISRDDGKTWQPLDNGDWNALSLPFVVGPQGRIALLNAAAFQKIKN